MDQQPAVREAHSAAAQEAGLSVKGSKRAREQPVSTSGALSEDLSEVSCCILYIISASSGKELATTLLKTCLTLQANRLSALRMHRRLHGCGCSMA